jgi:predicted ferric reductase
MWDVEIATLLGYGTLGCLWLVLVLILRFRWVERIFQGWPRAYHLHHIVGIVVLIFGLIHGFLSLSTVWDTGPWYSLFVFWFDPRDLISLSGSLALLSLLLVGAMGCLKRMSRRPWLTIHRTSLLSIVLVLWHGYELEVLTSAEPWRLWFWIIGLGLLFLLCLHRLGYAVLQHPLSFHVEAVVPMGSSLYQLILSTQDRRWQPGQFGYFRFFDPHRSGVSRERHPFTLLTRPTAGQMVLLIKAVGDDTCKLQDVAPGTPGDAQGPYGSFLPAARRLTPQVWLAGGLGVIPFMGVLEALKGIQERPPITLLLFVRPGGVTPFHSQLDSWTCDHSWFHWILVEDDADKPSGIERIKSINLSWRTHEFLIAGPHAMVKYWCTTLCAEGLPCRRIHTEDFLK